MQMGLSAVTGEMDLLDQSCHWDKPRLDLRCLIPQEDSVVNRSHRLQWDRPVSSKEVASVTCFPPSNPNPPCLLLPVNNRSNSKVPNIHMKAKATEREKEIHFKAITEFALCVHAHVSEPVFYSWQLPGLVSQIFLA